MRSKKTRPGPELGELERAVLEHLWQAGEADVVETHRAVGARREITVNTVGSALDRLYRKGLVTRSKVSHAYRYQPVLDRESFFHLPGIATMLNRRLARSQEMTADAEAVPKAEALAGYTKAYPELFRKLKADGWLSHLGSDSLALDCGTGTGVMIRPLLSQLSLSPKVHAID